MMCSFIIWDEQSTKELAVKIAKILHVGDVLALEGDLGAGKTTFTQGFARGLGITEPIDSPTFAIIKEYAGVIPLYHMDVYRLEESTPDLGLEEYFYGDGICIVEWASRIKSLLPKSTIHLSIRILEDGSRKFEIISPASRCNDLCKELSK